MHEPQTIVGITYSDRVHREEEAARIVAGYRQALAPYDLDMRLLTPSGPRLAATDLHGLLLAGGVDVDPAHYGEPRHPKLGEVDADRDALELDLARAAVAAGVPTFGICRGVQVLGVVLGGTLYQDIPCCVAGAVIHSAAKGEARHRVRLAAGSRLREIIGQDAVEVNSYHHQAVRTVVDGARAVAATEDGVIEALEGTGTAFLLGVQWHPERMLDDPFQVRLLAAFAAAARAFAARK